MIHLPLDQQHIQVNSARHLQPAGDLAGRRLNLYLVVSLSVRVCESPVLALQCPL